MGGVQVPIWTYLPTLTFVALAGFIVQRGWALSLFSRYPFFYLYVAWEVFRTAAIWTIIPTIGYESQFYYHFYYGSTALTPVFHLLVLSDIYFRFKTFEDKSHWYGLLAFIVVTIALSVPTTPNLYDAYESISMQFRVLFCAIILLHVLRNKDLFIGRNYKGILLGFVVFIFVKSIVHSAVMVRFVPDNAHFYLRQTTSILPWFVFAVAMSRYEAPALRPVVRSLRYG